MKTLRLWACLGAIFTNGVMAGCLGDLKVGPSGTGGAGGAGGSVSVGGDAGAGGNSMICTPGATAACDTGVPGICAAGMATCNADGTMLGPCQMVNAAGFDDCTTPEDEDCDGTAIASCTGAIDWITTRVGANAPPMDDAVYGIAVTPTGEYVVTGVVDGNINTAIDVTAGKLYLAKFDTAGVKQWERSLAANGMACGRDVAIDSQGNIIVIGDYLGTFSFDNQSFSSNNGSRDMFIAKFNAAGTTIWAKSYGTDSNDANTALVIDSSDNIVFTGWARTGIVNFGGGQVNVNNNDVFVAKLSPDGAHLWSKVFVNPSDQHGRAVAIAPNGDVVVGGESNGNFNLGGSPHTITNNFEAFIGRFSGADGAFLWSRVFVGTGDQFTRGISFLPNGNPVVLGRFANGIDFGGGNMLATTGNSTGFLAEFDAATGVHIRSRSFGTVGTTYPLGIAVDKAGHVYLEGSYNGTIDFGVQSFTAVNVQDEFTVKLDATTWTPLWLRSTGNTGDQSGLAIAVDRQGRAIVGGTFANEFVASTPANSLQSTGGEDLFLQRLLP